MPSGFNVGTVYGEVKLETAGFNKSVSTINKGQKDMTDKSKKTTSAFKGMWKQMAVGMGVTNLITSAFRKVSRQFSDTIKKGLEFGREWANVTTMLSISEKETGRLRGALLDISPTLGDVTSLAKGMYQVLSASIEPAKAIEFLGVAAKAAKAGLSEINVAVDALTTVINAYGMEAEEATNVSDIMFQTVKRGKLTFSELASSLGTVAPVAGTIGIKFEEVAAAIASLTRVGIPAATATMQLRQVFMAIIKPSDDALKTAKKLGIEWTTTALRAKGLGRFLLELKEKTQGNESAMASLVPNVRALTGVMALAGRASDGFKEDLILMADASGMADEAFEKQMKTAGFWVDTYKNQITKMKVVFFEAFVGNFKFAAENIEEFNLELRAMTIQAEMAGEISGGFFKTVWGGIKSIVNATTAQGEYNRMLKAAAEQAVRAEEITKAFNKVLSKGVGVFDKVKGGVQNLTDKLSTYNKVLELVEKGELKLNVITVMKLKAQKELIETYNFEQKELKELLSEYGSYTRILDAVKNGTIEVKKTTEIAGVETEKFTKKIKLLKNEFKALKTPSEILKKEVEDFKNSFAEFSVILPEIPETMDDVIGGLIQSVLVGSKQVQDHTKEVADEAERMAKRIEIDWTNVAEDMRQVWVENFQGIIDDTKDFGDILNSTFDVIASGIGSVVGEKVSGAVEKLGGVFEKMAGPIGVVAGTVVTAALGMFKNLLNIKTKAEKEAVKAAQAEQQFANQIQESKDVMSKYGEITDVTAEKIAELRKTHKGYIAESLAFADVIRDVGVTTESLNDLWSASIGILNQVSQGQIDAATGGKVLSDVFGEMVKGAKELGEEGSAGMVAFILEARNLGIEIASVTEYVLGQLGKIPGALDTLVGQIPSVGESIDDLNVKLKVQQNELMNMEDTGSEAYKTLQKEIAETQKQIQEQTKNIGEYGSELERLGGLALGTFNAMLGSGQTWNEAIKAMAPTLNELREKYDELGIEATGSLAKLFKVTEVTEANKELFSAIEANNTILEALGNTGWLTAKEFKDFSSNAYKDFKELEKLFGDDDAALRAMTPTLQTLADNAETYGYKLDDNTQRLVDQAKEMGLVTEAQETEQEQQERLFGELADTMSEIMEKLTDDISGFFKTAFGDAFADAEEGAKGASRGIGRTFDKMSFTIPFDYKEIGNAPSIPKGTTRGNFQGGTAFIPSGPTPIMVHPRELVDITPISELTATGRSRAGLGMVNKEGKSPTIIFNNEWHISGQAAMSPEAIKEMFDRNVNEMTRDIKGYLGRY